MNTYQIAKPVLEAYKNTVLKEERIAFLTTQAYEQLTEIAQDEEIYRGFLEKVKSPKKIDNRILWILLMSDEDIVDAYIEAFDKDFIDMIPVCDLADLLFYIVYLKKVEERELEGFDALLEYKTGGMQEVDQHTVTNLLVYIQNIKAAQVAIEF